MAAGVVFEETPSYYGLKNKIAIFSHEYSFEQIFKKKKKEAVPDGSLAFIKVALYWVPETSWTEKYCVGVGYIRYLVSATQQITQ